MSKENGIVEGAVGLIFKHFRACFDLKQRNKLKKKYDHSFFMKFAQFE